MLTTVVVAIIGAFVGFTLLGAYARMFEAGKGLKEVGEGLATYWYGLLRPAYDLSSWLQGAFEWLFKMRSQYPAGLTPPSHPYWFTSTQDKTSDSIYLPPQTSYTLLKQYVARGYRIKYADGYLLVKDKTKMVAI